MDHRKSWRWTGRRERRNGISHYTAANVRWRTGAARICAWLDNVPGNAVFARLVCDLNLYSISHPVLPKRCANIPGGSVPAMSYDPRATSDRCPACETVPAKRTEAKAGNVAWGLLPALRVRRGWTGPGRILAVPRTENRELMENYVDFDPEYYILANCAENSASRKPPLGRESI